jgi:hypothetical protein
VGSVTVAIEIFVVGRDGLAPVSTTTEVCVFHIDTSIDCVNINTLATFRSVKVLVKGTEREAVPVGNTGQTPGGVLLNS